MQLQTKTVRQGINKAFLKEPVERPEFDTFKNKLIVRRIYFGLYFSLVNKHEYLQHLSRNFLGDCSNLDTELKHHSIDTHCVLRKDWGADVDSTVTKRFYQRIKNLISSRCIELTELPKKGLLPEENSSSQKTVSVQEMTLPIFEDIDLKRLANEQEWQGFDEEKFKQSIKELKVEESPEELLELLKE